MNVRWCESLFVSVLLAVLAMPAVSFSDNLTTLVSSETEFHFVCEFDGVASLTEVVDVDSTTVYVHTVQVAVPVGAEIRLLASSGRGLQPVSSVTDKASVSLPLVKVSKPRTVRGHNFVSVLISPLKADGSGGLAMFGEVEIHLAFDRSRATVQTEAANDPGFDRVFASVIANYDVARNWPVAKRRVASQQLPSSEESAENLTDATQWYKVLVSQSGLYRLTGSDLEAVGISLSGLASDSIRLFNAGGLENSINNSDARPEFDEVSLMMLDGGDGSFGVSDRVVFYGESVNRWRYRTGYPDIYVNNHFNNYNVYWLAVSGSFEGEAHRMTQVDASLTGTVDTIITTCMQRAHVEQDQLLGMSLQGHFSHYYNWYWSDTTHNTLYVSTPGALEGDSATIIVRGQSGSAYGFYEATVNGVQADNSVSCNRYGCSFATRALLGSAGTLNRLDVRLWPSSGTIPPYFDFAEVFYPGNLLPQNNRIDFKLGNHDLWAEMQLIDSYSGTPTLFDLTDPANPVILSGFSRTTGRISFRDSLTLAGPNHYFGAQVTEAAAPVSITAVEVTDVRTSLSQADMIIVTPRSFTPYLDEYRQYRADQGISSVVTAVEDIMDNFSYGLYDPTAIRDYLKYMYENAPSPAPSAVLFVGDASYDFLDHLGTGMANYVPPYILGAHDVYGDDNYVVFGTFRILDGDTSYVDGDRGYDMMTARWPVRSRAEIDVIVNKIKTYESSETLGEWRSRITLVADDEFGERSENEVFHTTQTEELNAECIPPEYLRNKIYMWEYPLVNGDKPSVNRAIVDAFNDGSLIVNYVGHGNPDVWAHEHVLQRTSDLPQMTNYDRLPLVFAASCAIGFFDDPRREGMAEDFLALQSGGAIGVIAATRLVYSNPNAGFNREVFHVLMEHNGLSICESMFAAKLQRQYSNSPVPNPITNDLNYVYFGDPWLKLVAPEYGVELSARPDSLVALGRSRVAGRIVDGSGQTVMQDGTLQIAVYDSERDRTYSTQYSEPITYQVGGPRIFRGPASITNGEFDFQFVVPLDVSYGRPGARVSLYAVLDNSDGLGVVDSIDVSETLVEIVDSTGPTIVFGIAGRSGFISGDVISPDEQLVVSISDSSGINLAGGIGHGIVLVVDNAGDEAVDLTHLFEYDLDDFTSGSLAYQLDSLVPGEHKLKIKAWDNANNVSIVEFSAEMVAEGELAINELLNYPNPMGESTTFFFELTGTTERVDIEIFTLSGKNIWGTSGYGLRADRYPNDVFSPIWDGRDADGDRVATGVYIYKATAVPRSGDAIEQFGKIVVLN